MGACRGLLRISFSSIVLSSAVDVVTSATHFLSYLVVDMKWFFLSQYFLHLSQGINRNYHHTKISENVGEHDAMDSEIIL